MNLFDRTESDIKQTIVVSSNNNIDTTPRIVQRIVVLQALHNPAK